MEPPIEKILSRIEEDWKIAFFLFILFKSRENCSIYVRNVVLGEEEVLFPKLEYFSSLQMKFSLIHFSKQFPLCSLSLMNFWINLLHFHAIQCYTMIYKSTQVIQNQIIELWVKIYFKNRNLYDIGRIISKIWQNLFFYLGNQKNIL